MRRDSQNKPVFVKKLDKKVISNPNQDISNVAKID